MQKTFSQETLESLRKAPFFSKIFFFKTFLFLGVMIFAVSTQLLIISTYPPGTGWFRTQIYMQEHDLPFQIRISKSYHDDLASHNSPETREKAYALARAFAQDEKPLLKIYEAVQKEDYKMRKESIDYIEKSHFTGWYYAIFVSMALFAAGCFLLRRHLRSLGIYGKTIFFALRVATPSALRWAVAVVMFSQLIIFLFADYSNHHFVGAGNPAQQLNVDQYALEHGLLCSESMKKVNRLVWEALQGHVERFILLVNVLSIAMYGFLARRWSKK